MDRPARLGRLEGSPTWGAWWHGSGRAQSACIEVHRVPPGTTCPCQAAASWWAWWVRAVARSVARRTESAEAASSGSRTAGLGMRP